MQRMNTLFQIPGDSMSIWTISFPLKQHHNNKANEKIRRYGRSHPGHMVRRQGLQLLVVSASCKIVGCLNPSWFISSSAVKRLFGKQWWGFLDEIINRMYALGISNEVANTSIVYAKWLKMLLWFPQVMVWTWMLGLTNTLMEFIQKFIWGWAQAENGKPEHRREQTVCAAVGSVSACLFGASCI